MSFELVALALLSVLLLATNVFWAKIVFELNNRLMSRSFYEFSQAQALQTPKASSPPSSDGMHIDPVDERQAREINSLMGVF